MLIIINCLLVYILCVDIDECLSGPCPSDLICNNMDGSYSCDCPDGTMRSGADCICKNQLRSCVAILCCLCLFCFMQLHKHTLNMTI